MEVPEAVRQIEAIIDKVISDRSVTMEETKRRVEELRDEIRCNLEVCLESLQ